MKENVVKNYLKHSFEEMTKVTWPTKNQAVKLTIIVLIFCLIVAVLIGVVDGVLKKLHTLMIEQINVQQSITPVDITPTGSEPITVTPSVTTTTSGEATK